MRHGKLCLQVVYKYATSSHTELFRLGIGMLKRMMSPGKIGFVGSEILKISPLSFPNPRDLLEIVMRLLIYSGYGDHITHVIVLLLSTHLVTFHLTLMSLGSQNS